MRISVMSINPSPARVQPLQEGPPAELPPRQAADIARQMTEGVVGITVAMAALSMVSEIMAGEIAGAGVAATAGELV